MEPSQLVGLAGLVPYFAEASAGTAGAFGKPSRARLFTKAWMWVYNNERPHSSLGYKAPTAFLLKYGKLHHPRKSETEFPTFQQDGNYDWKSIVSFESN